jgi:hypothetical protein
MLEAPWCSLTLVFTPILQAPASSSTAHSDSPLMVLQLTIAQFLNQSSHPFKDANSMFSFWATS